MSLISVDSLWRQARNILMVRLDNLGDVLLCTPAMHAVRETLPDSRITLLAGSIGAQVGRLDPDIDDVIVYLAPWMDVWQALPLDVGREKRMITEIKERSFDAAIIFTSFRQSSLPAAYLCYLAEIPLRLGASIDGSGSLLTTRHKHPERLMHEVERACDLVAAVGFHSPDRDMKLDVPQRVRERAKFRLEQLGLGIKQPLVVIHPGCSMPARTYPWELYAEIGDLLTQTIDCQVVLTGTAAEVELVEKIRGQMSGPSVSLAGDSSFDEFAALISLSDLVITNNTGPMHVAAALKTPVITLFALTNPPEQWGPWNVPHRLLSHPVPCAICYSRVCSLDHACLRQVRPQLVIFAARELLAEVGSRQLQREQAIRPSTGSLTASQKACSIETGD